MKLNALFLSLIPAVAALPADGDSNGIFKRTSVATTDYIIFSITLPAFTTRRNNKNPSDLIWTSDGCTSSPDNPFKFPFVPACNRHDFGYHNFRAQSRFTEAGKLKIDQNFRTDLYYQCGLINQTSVCKALADVYYAFVRAFGGGDATKRDDALIQEYEDALDIYNQLVKEAQDAGELPILD